MEILQARILEWVAVPFSRGSFQSRDQTQSPTLQVDSLPAEPPGKVCIYILHIFFFLFKTIIDIKGTFHAGMGMIKDRNNKYLTEEIKTRWQAYTELYKKKVLVI